MRLAEAALLRLPLALYRCYSNEELEGLAALLPLE
jgi:hypothetical protein